MAGELPAARLDVKRKEAPATPQRVSPAPADSPSLGKRKFPP